MAAREGEADRPAQRRCTAMPHAAAAAGSYPVPPLVQVLAGSSVTGVMVLSCLLTTDTRALRQLHQLWRALWGAYLGVIHRRE